MKSPRPKMTVKNLTMIYGRELRRAQALLKAGRSTEEIRAQADCVVAVNNLDLTVHERELMVIMGLSGSGKSSLLKCLNLLNRPAGGEIIIDGDNILNYTRAGLRALRQNKISMVFQDFGLLSHRSVLENVEFGLEICRLDKKTRRHKARAVIQAVGLEGWEDKNTWELSGGMQQRVGLARALANDPQILLMDEPFSALDPLIRRQMRAELLELQKSLKKTIVFITHDIDEAFYLGDRVAIMKDGEIQQLGSPLEILRNPKTEYVESFIRDVNKMRLYTAGDIMTPLAAGRSDNGPVLGPEATLEQVSAMLQNHDLIVVADRDGRPLGEIDNKVLLAVLIKAS